MLACFLSACGGGGGNGLASAPLVPAPVATQSAKQGTITIKITVPGPSTAKTPRLKRILDTASSTMGILFTVYPHGGNPATQAVAVSGDDISGDSGSACTPSGVGVARSCSVQIAAPAVSTNDLLAQTYDQIIPANGTVPVGAHLLAAGVYQNLPVVAGSANGPIPLTLNPVVSSVTIAATPGTIHTLLPTNFSIAVYAYDAGGNLIIAPAYVDANGNSVTIPLSVSSNANSSVTLTTTSPAGSGTSITVAGSGTMVTGSYNGKAEVAANSSLAVTLTSTSATTSGSLNVVGLTTQSLGDNNLTTQPFYSGIAAPLNGTDQQIYYTAPGALDGWDSSGAQLTLPDAAVTGGLALYGSTDVVSGGTNSVNEFTVANPPAIVGNVCLSGLTCTAQGNIGYYQSGSTVYYTNGGQLYDINGSDSAVQLSTFGGTATFAGLAINQSNGSIWLADANVGGSLYEYTGSTFYQSSAGNFFDVALDSGSNGWVTSPSNKAVEEYSDPRVAPTTYNAVLGNPEYITGDGVNPSAMQAMYFTENTAGGIALGRIDLTSGAVTEAPIGVAGGAAGPLVQIPNGEIGVVHYSGTTAAGEFLLVTP